MIPWEFLESGPVPESSEALGLYRRGAEFSIRVGARELMNSRVHGSEEALAELALAEVAGRPQPRILIGGLGMGFTLAAALRRLGPTGQVVVAELVPAVVAWNQGPLAALAGHPLRDSRVIVHTGDIAPLLREEARGYDAVLLDVDNGPAGLTRPQNAWLYSRPGLEAAQEALRPAGILAVWSSGPHPVFVRRLHRAGFTVTEVRAPARAARKGRRHTIWLARRAA